MKALILAASLILAFPAAAAAQARPERDPPLPPPIKVPRMVVPGANEGFETINRSAAAIRRLRQDGGGTPAQRRERAERLAVLVNSGQCQAAHDTALQEEDRIMAERIGEVCYPRNPATRGS